MRGLHVYVLFSAKCLFYVNLMEAWKGTNRRSGKEAERSRDREEQSGGGGDGLGRQGERNGKCR